MPPGDSFLKTVKAQKVQDAHSRVFATVQFSRLQRGELEQGVHCNDILVVARNALLDNKLTAMADVEEAARDMRPEILKNTINPEHMPEHPVGAVKGLTYRPTVSKTEERYRSYVANMHTRPLVGRAAPQASRPADDEGLSEGVGVSIIGRAVSGIPDSDETAQVVACADEGPTGMGGPETAADDDDANANPDPEGGEGREDGEQQRGHSPLLPQILQPKSDPQTHDMLVVHPSSVLDGKGEEAHLPDVLPSIVTRRHTCAEMPPEVEDPSVEGTNALTARVRRMTDSEVVRLQARSAQMELQMRSNLCDSVKERMLGKSVNLRTGTQHGRVLSKPQLLRMASASSGLTAQASFTLSSMMTSSIADSPSEMYGYSPDPLKGLTLQDALQGTKAQTHGSQRSPSVARPVNRPYAATAVHASTDLHAAAMPGGSPTVPPLAASAPPGYLPPLSRALSTSQGIDVLAPVPEVPATQSSTIADRVQDDPSIPEGVGILIRQVSNAVHAPPSPPAPPKPSPDCLMRSFTHLPSAVLATGAPEVGLAPGPLNPLRPPGRRDGNSFKRILTPVPPQWSAGAVLGDDTTTASDGASDGGALSTPTSVPSSAPPEPPAEGTDSEGPRPAPVSSGSEASRLSVVSEGPAAPRASDGLGLREKICPASTDGAGKRVRKEPIALGPIDPDTGKTEAWRPAGAAPPRARRKSLPTYASPPDAAVLEAAARRSARRATVDEQIADLRGHLARTRSVQQRLCEREEERERAGKIVRMTMEWGNHFSRGGLTATQRAERNKLQWGAGECRIRGDHHKPAVPRQSNRQSATVTADTTLQDPRAVHHMTINAPESRMVHAVLD